MAPKKMTDAEKAKLKKMLMKGGNLDKIAKERAAAKAKAKASTSYSPAPMSAAAKAKAAAAGKATAAKTKPKSTAAKVAGVVGKVAGRAKTVAREVRDVPTAAANVYKSRSMPQGGVAKFAKKDLKAQIKEVGTAIKSGKKGTEAAQETSKLMKGRVGGGGLDYYISKPKKKRK
jgi:hypothetical protein